MCSASRGLEILVCWQPWARNALPIIGSDSRECSAGSTPCCTYEPPVECFAETVLWQSSTLVALCSERRMSLALLYLAI